MATSETRVIQNGGAAGSGGRCEAWISCDRHGQKLVSGIDDSCEASAAETVELPIRSQADEADAGSFVFVQFGIETIERWPVGIYRVQK